MKRRTQILSLLSNRKPATETDKKEILSHCRDKRMHVYFHRDCDSFEPITYDQFLQWCKLRHYSVEDVITDKDGTIYLITDFEAGESVSGAYLNPVGKLCTGPVPVPVINGRRKSTGQEKTELQRAMNKAGFIWSPFKKKLMASTPPDKNYFITIWVIADLVGMGIFKEVDKNGDLVLYCYTDGGSELKYKEPFVMGPIIDYAIREAGPRERSDIIRKLHNVNLLWHGKLKRFEPLNLRRRPGDVYFYVNSRGRVVTSKESGRRVDDERFNFGNYFHSPNEAVIFRNQTAILRNDHLIGKLSLHD